MSSHPVNDLLTTTLREVRLNAVDTGYVFMNRNGQPYRSYHTAFERVARKGEIKDFASHDLRHTFASRLVMSGVALPTVQELMGHKDNKVTLRNTHLSSDRKQGAVEKLEGFGKKSHQLPQHLTEQDSIAPHKLLNH